MAFMVAIGMAPSPTACIDGRHAMHSSAKGRERRASAERVHLPEQERGGAVSNPSLAPAQFSTQAGGRLQATNDLDTFLQHHGGLPMSKDHARMCYIRKQSSLAKAASQPSAPAAPGMQSNPNHTASAVTHSSVRLRAMVLQDAGTLPCRLVESMVLKAHSSRPVRMCGSCDTTGRAAAQGCCPTIDLRISELQYTGKLRWHSRPLACS